MSNEEPHEDGKLKAAKSWFTRSASSITFRNASIEVAPDEVSSGLSMSKEGPVESGSAGFTSLRQQLSMRRSMGSGEIKKEPGPGSPSMTVKNVTPLTPLTPLKWKSNLREQEEEKVTERSRLGSAFPVGSTYEEYSEGNPAAKDEKEERPADGQRHGSPVAEHDGVNAADELSVKVKLGDIGEDVGLESLEGPDRKTSSGDDVMTMTIEFLRARLLSERSASKTAKSQIQQLSQKVSELEEKLDQALKDQKKAEVSAQEAFTKLKFAETQYEGTNGTIAEVADRLISTSMKGSPLSRSRARQEDTRYLQQDASSNIDLSRTNSNESSGEERDPSTRRSLSEAVNKTEKRTNEQGRPGVSPALQDMSDRSHELPHQQESRAVIENRLRNMWSKMSEDMTVLAEVRREDVVRKELMSWMGQVPAVLQNVMPKDLVSPPHDVGLGSESERLALQGVPRRMVDGQPELTRESIQANDQLQAEPKRGSLLREQSKAQENMQREWKSVYEQAEKLKRDTLTGNSSPNASASNPELQNAESWQGPNGVVDNLPFLKPHLATLAKSRSTLDLPTRSIGHNSDTNSPHRDEAYGELDPWNRERPRRQEAENRHHDYTFQNTPPHGRMALEPYHSKHSRFHQDPSRTPSIRSTEDGYKSSKPDLRPGESSWDDRDGGHSGRHRQAQPRHGDANDQMERDSYYRASQIEESCSYSQPENTNQHRHRHQRSHSDNYDWPAVEDHGLLYQQLEPSPGLARRQSYSGYSPAMAADPRHTSFDKLPGFYDDLRYADERMYRPDELRRNSFPATKGESTPRQLNSTQISRTGHLIAEPTLSLGYGPAYDAPPKEDSPVQQSPKAGLNKNISDVLRALQLAKAKIQNGGAGSMEQRSTRTQVSPPMKSGYRMDPSAQYM